MKTTHSGGVSVIELEGNLLGGPDAGVLKNKLQELVDEGKKLVIVDLKRVEFINSSGLAMLIKGASIMKESGGGLKIAHASGKILELIKITKLTGVLETYGSVAEASATFKK